MKRRQFNAMLGAASLGLTQPSEFSGEPQQELKPEILHLSRNNWVPNNERLPVLLYRAVLPTAETDPASWFEARFRQHGWPPQWRDGVYDFHHYHSTAHEVLGFAQGQAR
ncbi:MAG: cupin, partial [Acidobacteriaceae bacterium]|nr:cupin [Acidobacteriaceae bacterium]